jgi:hypothetical protein
VMRVVSSLSPLLVQYAHISLETISIISIKRQ